MMSLVIRDHGTLIAMKGSKWEGVFQGQDLNNESSHKNFRRFLFAILKTTCL